MLSLIILTAYCAIFFFSVLQPLLFAQFVTGTILGFFFIYLDRLLHAVYLAPEEEFSKLITEQLRKGSVVGFIRLLMQAEGLQKNLLTRSGLFMGVFLVLAIFVLTSTGSFLGIGLILGMGLRYCFDMWYLMQTPELFVQQFLVDVKINFTVQDVQRITLVWIIGYTCVSVWAWL